MGIFISGNVSPDCIKIPNISREMVQGEKGTFPFFTVGGFFYIYLVGRLDRNMYWEQFDTELSF